MLKEVEQMREFSLLFIMSLQNSCLLLTVRSLQKFLSSARVPVVHKSTVIDTVLLKCLHNQYLKLGHPLLL
jgi:hypothetical protein